MNHNSLAQFGVAEGADTLKVLGFRHSLEIYRLDTGEIVDSEVKLNRIPQEGIDFLIQSPFGALPPISDFYCLLFTKNVLSDAATSAADIPGVFGEFVDYSETTRPIWTRTYNGAGTQDNAGNEAIFTPTAERLVYGSMMVSNPVKGSNTGLVLSAVRFSTAKPLSVGLAARLVCGLTYIPANVI